MSTPSRSRNDRGGQYGPRDFKPIHRAILCGSRSTDEDGTTIYHPKYLQNKSDAWLAISPGVAISRDEIEDIFD